MSVVCWDIHLAGHLVYLKVVCWVGLMAARWAVRLVEQLDQYWVDCLDYWLAVLSVKRMAERWAVSLVDLSALRSASAMEEVAEMCNSINLQCCEDIYHNWYLCKYHYCHY